MYQLQSKLPQPRASLLMPKKEKLGPVRFQGQSRGKTPLTDALRAGTGILLLERAGWDPSGSRRQKRKPAVAQEGFKHFSLRITCSQGLI